nr:hypothetical protein HK105_000852 [Polyrhizophydium stewartii]
MPSSGDTDSGEVLLKRSSTGRRTLRRGNTINRSSGTLNRVGSVHNPAFNMLAKPLENSRPTAWVRFSWAITCCFPASILSSFGITNQSSQQAWREKVALCWIAFILSALVVFFLVFFNNLLCPSNLLDNTIAINAFGGVVVFGRMYNSFMATPPYNTLFEQTDALFGGIDASGSFEQPAIAACQRPNVQAFAFAQVKSACAPNCINLTELTTQHNFLPYSTLTGLKGENVTVIPDPAYEWGDIKNRKLVAIRQKVLSLAPYFDAHPDPVEGDLIDPLLRKAQTINDGTHILWRNKAVSDDVLDCLTQKYYAGVLSQLPMSCIMSRLITIIVSFTVIGILITRFAMALFFDWFLATRIIRFPDPAVVASRAQHTESGYAKAYSTQTGASGASHLRKRANRQSNVPSYATTDIELQVTAPAAAGSNGLRSGSIAIRQNPNVERPVPNPTDLYTVLFVTCYSEGEASLRATLDSLAATDYDDCKKLLFVVADGIVKGTGNEASTPDLLIRMMHHDGAFGDNPPAFSYVAVATGSKQHNKARVYCGSYEVNGRHVPMVLVVKIGTEDEADQAKPGNRGKRDSQLVLMNFFSRVVLNDRMTPLDYDIFRKIHHLMGVTPDQFEIVLMVDADTKVATDSLRFMINAMHNDPLIMGLCGETRIANKKQSWVTTIQVFEYFISHHLGKAFESVFGGVTCLPGCFCMYRIKTFKDGAVLPILANPDIIEQYSTNETFTLHQKNLLLLGEDRFLTTLMLRTFPKRHMVFVPSAYCKTVVPDKFSVLVSQRRRWINSTIHNLMELVFVNNLCGTFCFSMQFIVAMDLLGTAVLPAGLACTYYLIFAAVFRVKYNDVTAYLNLSIMCVSIFLPMFLVFFTGRRLQYILWMLVYLLALPIWHIILPLYAFWHFDDFSWGETRKITGDDKSHSNEEEIGLFDGTQIPFKRWDEYERESRRERNTYLGVDAAIETASSAGSSISASHYVAPFAPRPTRYMSDMSDSTF